MGMTELVFTVLGSLVATALWAEFDAWSPKIAARLALLAAQRLPTDLKDRYAEEWLSHLADTPGRLSKVVVGLGFIYTAHTVRMETRRIKRAKEVQTRTRMSPLGAFNTRALDMIISATALIILSPLLFASAILIKMADGGPVLFRQRRIGKDGEVFHRVKFRTMRLISHGSDDVGRDQRISRVGSFLRRTSIDNLPQLVNVLRGHMTLMGVPAEPSD